MGQATIATIRKQKGMTLTGLVFVSIVLIFVALLAMKVFPVVVDYYTIVGNVKAVTNDTALREAGVAQIRGAYLKRMQVSGATDVLPEDLDISKDGNDIVISFAYSKKVRLFGNVSLLLDFDGNTAPSSGK